VLACLLGFGKRAHELAAFGGLWRKMRITALTFCIASLSISGIFPFSGFWSKDEIVASTLRHPIFLVLTLVIAFMTAFYMWRLCFLTFFGQPRDQHRYDHAHESPKNMTYPLVFLAVLATCAGWVGIPWLPHGFASFVFHGEPYHPHASIPLMAFSLLVGGSGIFIAYLMYYRKSISAEKMGARFKPIYTLLYHKYYFDELYDYIIIKPILGLGRLMWKFDAGVVDGAVNGSAWLTMKWADLKQWFDTWIVDGAVNGAGWLVRQVGNVLRYIQTGSVQLYAAIMLFGAAGLIYMVLNRVPITPMLHFVIFAALMLALLFLLLRIFAEISKGSSTRPFQED
jgi:NADH-quinone oxidoreductase subunit L